MTCSVVITCFNKEQFIKEAVESALNQTHPAIEVIVVDDGSTDGSALVLSGFGERITVVRQGNLGQAAAINLGVSRSSGDIVFMLDGDDLLLPDTAARVVRTWRPELSKVHYRLYRIDEGGKPTGGPPMPPYRELPSGDLSATLATFGLYPSPPSSGNAYGRSFLNQVLPLPPEAFPVAADTFLIGAAALFGPIETLVGFGGAYRETDSGASRGGIDNLIRKAKVDDCYVEFIQARAAEAGIAKQIRPRWPQYLKERLVIEKFRGNSGFTLTLLVFRYAWTVTRWPEYPAWVRVRMLSWALIILLIPRHLLQPIPGILGPVISLRGEL